MVRDRHEVCFEPGEVVSWMRTLPWMKAHGRDTGHLLLETHAVTVAALIGDITARTRRAAGEAP